MTKEQQEVERLRRLRDRQVDARDPTHADRRRHTAVSRRPRDTFSIGDELKALPYKVKWMFWGAFWGIFVGIFFSVGFYLAFQANWWAYLMTGAILFCAFLGFFFGQIRD